MRLGNFKDAQRALTKTIQLGGGDGLTFGLLGFALGGTDDQIGAESAYRMASMLDPTVLDYRMGLARALFKQRRFAEAATLAGTLVAQYPDRGDLWMLQANAYAGMNELKKAAENLELVDRLGQSTAESLHLLGDIYTNDELTDLAASAYLRAIAKDGKADVARALRAAKALAARAAHAECEQVLGAIDKAFAAKMDDGAKKDALKLRARIAVARGAGEDEARILEQTVALDPLDGEALILLGQYHARNGKPDLAILQYERAAGVPAFEADAKIRHAQLLVGQARYAEALPLLRRAQQVKPRDNVQQFLDQVERVAQGK
jgi:tetratricopeptide (TPR) repeat protein